MMISDKKSEINLCQVWNVAFVDADTLNDDKNTERHDTQTNSENKPYNKVSPRGRRNDMPPPPADGSLTAAKIAADLRPSADGSAVRTSLVAGGG